MRLVSVIAIGIMCISCSNSDPAAQDANVPHRDVLSNLTRPTVEPISVAEARTLLLPHLDTDEWLGEVAVRALEESGQVLLQGVAESPKAARVIVLDHTGTPRNRRSMLEEEASSRFARMGRMTRPLAEAVEKLTVGDTVAVVISLRFDTAPLEVPAALDGVSWEDWLIEKRASRANELATVRAPLIAFLESRGRSSCMSL